MMHIIDKKNKKIEKFLTSTKKELDKIFGFKLNEPAIIFLSSREQMDAIWERKTKDWQVGGARLLTGTKNGIIFIFNSEAYIKESSHENPADFWKTLKHEYCHIYFRQITGGFCPLWLNEGLACYLAGQEKSGGDPMAVFSYFDKSDGGIYAPGYFWVKLLVKKFGWSKMRKLIFSLKSSREMTPGDFSKIFFSIYGFRFDTKYLRVILNKKI